MRFPEFNEPWGCYKVSDILDFYSTNSLSWEQLEFTDGELRNLHYGMIHVGLPTLLNLKESKLPTIKEGNEPKSYTLCINGDVAFADASEDTNDVAKAIELVETDGQKVVFGLHTIHGRDNKGLTEDGFKGYLFSSKVFHDQIRRIAQGTKVFSISNKNFSECFVGIPSKAEQTKIARLLSLLDKRIAVQSKLIEDLQQLKSALVDELFCDKANWVTYKCKDILHPVCERNKALKINNVLSASQEHGMISRDELDIDIKYESSAISTYKIVQPGDYVLHLRSFQGGLAFSRITGICSPAYTIFRPTKAVTYGFLEEFFMSKRFINSLRLVTYGIRDGRSINVDEFLNMNISIPNMDTQCKIVQILSVFRQRLNNAQSILQKYIVQKHYLLGQMFI